jgi:hypothetical protein
MSKKEKSDKAVELIETTEIGTPESPAAAKAAKPESKKKKAKAADSKKLHIEIARGNWKRLDTYIGAYNTDPGRITPKIGVAHIVNQALARMLGASKGGN